MVMRRDVVQAAGITTRALSPVCLGHHVQRRRLRAVRMPHYAQMLHHSELLLRHSQLGGIKRPHALENRRPSGRHVLRPRSKRREPSMPETQRVNAETRHRTWKMQRVLTSPNLGGGFSEPSNKVSFLLDITSRLLDSPMVLHQHPQASSELNLFSATSSAVDCAKTNQ